MITKSFKKKKKIRCESAEDCSLVTSKAAKCHKKKKRRLESTEDGSLVNSKATKCFKKKKKRRCCESVEKVVSNDDQILVSLPVSNLLRRCCESAEKVGSIDDLITEILLCLPASSLIRFKSVSKKWLSLINSPDFSRLHIRRLPRLSGLFVRIDSAHLHYRYIPLDNSSSEQRTISFPDSSGTNDRRIIQSCNGLLLLAFSPFKLCIYNPTTSHLTTIPPPPPWLSPNYDFNVKALMVLAFDPSRSPYYKLVFPVSLKTGGYQILVYSSKTQLWKVCGDQLSEDNNFWIGVYLNGAVHYMGLGFEHSDTKNVYLKIDDEERLEAMPMPPIPKKNNRKYVYFGQSGGRLHLITANVKKAAVSVFDVYEMEKDYSEWYVRYQVVVELREVYTIEIMSIVHGGEREEDSFLVFKTQVDGFKRFMKYKFADKSLKMLFQIQDLGPLGRGDGQPITAPFIHTNFTPWLKAYEFIQSLSPV